MYRDFIVIRRAGHERENAKLAKMKLCADYNPFQVKRNVPVILSNRLRGEVNLGLIDVGSR